MFSQLDWVWKSFHRESRILILGLDNAGKTAILYSLKLGEAIEYTIPTIGFNVEQVKIGTLNIHMWDMGGQTTLRDLWPHYYEQSDGVVFVLDSSDVDRFDTARQELHTLMSHKELNSKPFLILANKQDLPNAVGQKEVVQRMGLETVNWTPWHVIECCATQNQRAKLGFEWLAGQI